MSDVPEGYKMSEVGVIPEEWEVKKLGEIASGIASGKSKLKSSTGIYPVYGSTGIIGSYDFYDYEGKKILVARVGANAGTINIVEGKYCVSDNTLIIQFNQNMDILFFYYLLSNCKLNALVFGSGQPLITGSQLKDLSIFLPPLPEQQAIASALSDVDALITALEQLITKKRNIKQGTMQQLLAGKKRLPGFGGGWEVKKLGEIVTFSNGKAHENSISENGQFIVINSKFISTEGDIKKYSDSCLCPVSIGEIVMVMSDVPNGKAISKCFYIDDDEKYTLNQRICSLKALDDDSKFLFYLINRHPYYLTFDDGVKQTNLRKDDVLGCPLKMPLTLKEQQAIAQILSDMDTEIEALEQKQDKYKAIKHGMMQELLTGKRRLLA